MLDVARGRVQKPFRDAGELNTVGTAHEITAANRGRSRIRLVTGSGARIEMQVCDERYRIRIGVGKSDARARTALRAAAAARRSAVRGRKRLEAWQDEWGVGSA